MEEELKQPMMTSTPLKSEPGKHLFQKRSQQNEFGSPSRLQMNLMKKNLANVQPQQVSPQPQQQQEFSMFPHNCSDVPQQRLRNPVHIYPPHRTDPYSDNHLSRPVRTCDTIQECPEPSESQISQSDVRARSEVKPRRKRRSWRKSDLNSVSEEDEGVVNSGGTAAGVGVTGGDIEFSFTRILEAETDSAALLRSGVSRGRN